MSTDPTVLVLSRLLDVATQRQQVHMGNLSNVNTPGYKTREVRFEDAFRTALSEDGLPAALGVQAQVAEVEGLAADNDGNNVSSEREVLAMTQNKTLYDSYVMMLRGKNKMIDLASGAAP